MKITRTIFKKLYYEVFMDLQNTPDDFKSQFGPGGVCIWYTSEMKRYIPEESTVDFIVVSLNIFPGRSRLGVQLPTHDTIRNSNGNTIKLAYFMQRDFHVFRSWEDHAETIHPRNWQVEINAFECLRNK